MDINAFRRLPLPRQGTELLAMPETRRSPLLRRLKDDEIVALLKYLDPDDAAEIVRSVALRRRGRVVRGLSSVIRSKVRRLLSFHPHDASGMMELNYIQVPTSATYADVAKDIARHENSTGKFPVILAVEDGRLAGELHGHDLVRRKPSDKIGSDLRPAPSVRFDAREREVRRLLREHPHNRVVVLDEDGSIMGVVFTDDLLRALRSQAARSLYDFAGVRQEEDVHDPVSLKVRSRWIWLVINLGTAFLAASVVGLFSSTIERVVVLAAYMPIVAGMGGNAATQTLAVMVRGLSMKEIELATGWRVVMAEIGTGFVNGAVNGIIVAVIAALVNQNPMLGLVTGTAMVFNLMVAGCFGALIPMVMHRLGKDPATSATIFITTCTDVLGFSVFLGLASLLL
jgi:magnesium transporter